ncbi:MAG: glycosyltransferase family 4 protein [Bacteriovoracaceae bacterium]|jgi:glycosyltransferase involved in cell wall biosynthesis
MRERIRLSDLNILYICLSLEWGTTERRCLSDAVYFRNTGGAAFILCRQNSLIDKEAEKEDIPRLYFPTSLNQFRQSLNFYFQVEQILKKHQFDVIHTYSVETVIPLGAALRSSTHIPLILTFNENVPLKKKLFIEKFFLKRLDSVFTFSSHIQDLAHEAFPISIRKIHTLGLGLEAMVVEKMPSELVQVKLGMFVDRTTTMRLMQGFAECIPGILQLFHDKMPDFKLVFTFISDRNWFDHPLYNPMKRMYLERGLENHISFETKSLRPQSFRDIHLYIGLPHQELLSDIDVLALLGQTPVLLPRTSSRQLLTSGGKIGETYYPGDGRELKEKTLKIFANYEYYMDQLMALAPDLMDFHSADRYSEAIYSQYERLYAQRLRYSQVRRKLA